MSTAERLRNEGRAEGRAAGRAEGRAEIVLRQLERRFGTLPANVIALVRAAAEARLDRWADAVLTAATLDEVLRG